MTAGVACAPVAARGRDRWRFASATGARAQDASPYAIDIPPWFTETFLDFREDIADAAKDGRRLMVYFGQDGCPYCRQLMVTNFSQRRIVDKTHRHFVAIALNIWGDREVTWLDGRTMSEKALARALDVQFTPTLLFFDEKGSIVARLNGYYPPHKFEAVLDYVAGKHEKRETLAAYIARRTPVAASATLADEPFFVKPPYVLTRAPGGKPLAVVFETPDCAACDEMHRDLFRRPEVQRAARSLRRRPLRARRAHRADHAGRRQGQGRRVGARSCASPTRRRSCSSTPSGREVFRVDAYLRAFHFASALDYVASGAYRNEPSFQRYVQARAERLRAGGESVDLWQ